MNDGRFRRNGHRILWSNGSAGGQGNNGLYWFAERIGQASN